MTINMHVVNEGINIQEIRVIGVAGSSIFLVGDTHVISTSAAFDTPPESVSYFRGVPLSPERR